MKALLVRVGIDSGGKSGGWNAPVDLVTDEFAYVPIKEEDPEEVIPKYKRTYEQFKVVCKELGKPLHSKFFMKNNTYVPHLDPDFCNLTYGDIYEKGGKRHRGKPLLELQEDDLLVFYAGLDPGRWENKKRALVQAIIGLYVIEKKPTDATEIPNIDSIRGKNAHTRRKNYSVNDIIVFAKPAPLSGRLERCIQISEHRSNNNYYLKQSLFNEWGGFLDRNNSPVSEVRLQLTPLFNFGNPEKFYEWFRNQNKNNRLVECNNPLAMGE